MKTRIKLIFILIIVLGFSSTAQSAEVSISRIDNAVGAQYKTLTVSIDTIVSEISSFNLTISYDQSSCLVYKISPGSIFSECGWEYFNYRLVSKDSVIAQLADYPVNLINVTGIASRTQSPPPICNELSASFFDIEMLLKRDFFYLSNYQPFRFFWRDCDDNLLASRSGDTIFAVQNQFENLSPTQSKVPFSSEYPGYGRPLTACPTDGNAHLISNLDFINGAVVPLASDTEGCGAGLSGDINLNGLRFEISDVILFIEYFVKGISVFMINQAGQISSTDCNCDGTVLTVTDLHCYLRIAMKDEGINPKIPVFSQTNFKLNNLHDSDNETIELISDNDLALVYTRFTSVDNSELSISDFTFNETAETGRIGDTITMLMLDLEAYPVMSTGTNNVFEFSGNKQLDIETWVVDMDGGEGYYKLETGTLPDSPELLQNYPNPFNPTTTIGFSLPKYTDWSIEIYNVTAQLVNRSDGASVGRQEVEWDGKNLNGISVSSGVYFYKLVTNDETSSRKMLLLK